MESIPISWFYFLVLCYDCWSRWGRFRAAFHNLWFFCRIISNYYMHTNKRGINLISSIHFSCLLDYWLLLCLEYCMCACLKVLQRLPELDLARSSVRFWMGLFDIMLIGIALEVAFGSISTRVWFRWLANPANESEVEAHNRENAYCWICCIWSRRFFYWTLVMVMSRS